MENSVDCGKLVSPKPIVDVKGIQNRIYLGSVWCESVY